MFPSMRVFPALFALVFIGLGPVTAPGPGAEEAGPLPHAAELTAMLGWTPEEAAASFGVPESMFVHRGGTAEEDNIVFYYQDCRYLFWFRDRVWQVRADERWSGEVDGVRMGMTREGVAQLWGAPINDGDEAPSWMLPDQGYPVRIRLYFVDDRLADIYVYRSDW